MTLSTPAVGKAIKGLNRVVITVDILIPQTIYIHSRYIYIPLIQLNMQRLLICIHTIFICPFSLHILHVRVDGYLDIQNVKATSPILLNGDTPNVTYDATRPNLTDQLISYEAKGFSLSGDLDTITQVTTNHH